VDHGVDASVGDRLVFVVGARRSGTNWLQRVLCAHPDVIGTHGESYLFSRGLVPLMERFHHGSPTAPVLGSVFVDRGRALEAVRGVCDVVFGDLLALDGPAERLVDRTPEHVTCLDLIGEVYPSARVIHIIRDGRDVVRSLLSMDWGPRDAEVAAEEWRAAVVDGRRQGARLERYLEVRYEGLLAEPDRGFGALFAWLDVAVDRAAMDEPMREAARAFTVDPKMATIAAGKWREGLDPTAMAALQRIAGDALVELGYAGDERPSALPARLAARAGMRRRLASAISRTTPRSGSSAGEAERQMRKLLQANAQVVNRFLSALALGATDEVRSCLDEAVVVRLLGAGEDGHEVRGVEAREHLLSVLTADPVLRWPQTRGEVNAAVPTTTAFLSFERTDGERRQRVLSLTVTGDQVTAVTYLRPDE
jgi:ketosteroid isomerase-like protein